MLLCIRQTVLCILPAGDSAIAGMASQTQFPGASDMTEYCGLEVPFVSVIIDSGCCWFRYVKIPHILI